jgi:hypothetical protein
LIYKEWKNGEATWVQNGWCNIKSIPSTPSEGGGGGGGGGTPEKASRKWFRLYFKRKPAKFQQVCTKINNFHLSSKQWFHPPQFGLNSSNVRIYVLIFKLKACVIIFFVFQKGLKEDNSRKMWGSTILVQYKMEHFPFG